MNIMNDPTLLRTQAYIDGKWVDAEDGRTLSVTNPANGEVLAEVASVGAAETRRAIECDANVLVDQLRGQQCEFRLLNLRDEGLQML